MARCVRIRLETLCVIPMLSDKDAGQLFMHILEYINGITPVIESKLLKVAFIPIRIELQREMDKDNSKDNHWNWKGGITPKNLAIRNGTANKNWRKEVFERDNYTCQHCQKIGGTIHAHHIKEFSKFPELRFVLSNGLTLCKKCHNKEHSKHK